MSPPLKKRANTRAFNHVLHGVISPQANIGPDDIRIRELLDRVAGGAVSEVIMATNPTIEGKPPPCTSPVF
jgi:recombination protein RecR